MSRANDFVCDASTAWSFIANGLKPFKRKRELTSQKISQYAFVPSIAIRNPPNNRVNTPLGRHQYAL
jgi:hypothetical protein